MVASDYGQRPSQLLGLEDEWVALDMDMAVFEYGRWVLARLEETEKAPGGKLKPKWTLQQILDGEPLNRNKLPPVVALFLFSDAEGMDI